MEPDCHPDNNKKKQVKVKPTVPSMKNMPTKPNSMAFDITNSHSEKRHKEYDDIVSKWTINISWSVFVDIHSIVLKPVTIIYTAVLKSSVNQKKQWIARNKVTPNHTSTTHRLPIIEIDIMGALYKAVVQRFSKQQN